MEDATFIAMERLRAQNTSPAVLWIANFFWPGLGNMLVGQVGLGILFGLLEWACLLFAFLTLGIGGIACVLNWVVASAIGHSRITSDYDRAVAALGHPIPATPVRQ